MTRLLLVVFLALSLSVEANLQRFTSAQRKFVVDNPCPTSDKPTPECDGYELVYVVPPCLGGRDHPSNIAWLDSVQAYEKRRVDQAACAKKKGVAKLEVAN